MTNKIMTSIEIYDDPDSDDKKHYKLDLKEMYGTKKPTTDLLIKTNSENPIYFSRFVLAENSDYFEKMFSGNWADDAVMLEPKMDLNIVLRLLHSLMNKNDICEHTIAINIYVYAVKWRLYYRNELCDKIKSKTVCLEDINTLLKTARSISEYGEIDPEVEKLIKDMLHKYMDSFSKKTKITGIHGTILDTFEKDEYVMKMVYDKLATMLDYDCTSTDLPPITIKKMTDNIETIDKDDTKLMVIMLPLLEKLFKCHIAKLFNTVTKIKFSDIYTILDGIFGNNHKIMKIIGKIGFEYATQLIPHIQSMEQPTSPMYMFADEKDRNKNRINNIAIGEMHKILNKSV